MSDRHLLCPDDNCLGQIVPSHARGHEVWHCQTCQMVVSLATQALVSYNRGRRAAVLELGAAFVDQVFEVQCGTCGRTTVNAEAGFAARPAEGGVREKEKESVR